MGYFSSKTGRGGNLLRLPLHRVDIKHTVHLEDVKTVVSGIGT